MDANKVVELLRQYMAIDDIEEAWRYAMWADMALKLPITDGRWWNLRNNNGYWNAYIMDRYGVEYMKSNNELSLAICEAWLEWRMAQDE